jgi:hypothetical protein
MKKLVYGLAISFVLAGFSVWADNTAPAATPVAGAPAAVATPKPLPPDVKAARDKWLDAHVAEIQAHHDLETVKMKYQVANNQKCLSDAQAKKDAAKVTKYQAKLTALGKIQADQDQILSFKLDRIKELKADDKSDALNDTDQIKALQDDIKAQWQSTK